MVIQFTKHLRLLFSRHIKTGDPRCSVKVLRAFYSSWFRTDLTQSSRLPLRLPLLTNAATFADVGSIIARESLHEDYNNTDNMDKRSASEILAGLPRDEQKRLKILQLEFDVLGDSGVRVPTIVSDEDWLYILRHCQAMGARKKYYIYLFKRENRKITDREKKEVRSKVHEERQKIRQALIAEQETHFKNTFLLFLQEATMQRFYRNNLCFALMNGPHLVVDFDFEANLTLQEQKELCNQLVLSYAANKLQREPFHFHFCNLRPNGFLARKLRTTFGNMDEMVVTVTDRSYTECYPRERLVYLSPNAPTRMDRFNSDDVYIIGGIVDKAGEDPLTYAKAKKENIRTVRFPLDRYVK